MKQKSVKQRVFDILRWAMFDHLNSPYCNGRGYIFYAGQQIPCANGWIAQSVFANPTITGSTEGKRRLRELRADPEIQAKYIFEKKHERNRYYYRIMPRKREPINAQHSPNKIKLQFVGA